MAYHLTHDHPIFLLHKALIPFLIGTSSRKGNLLTHTKVSDFVVDKLPTIISIEAQDRKREEHSGALESCQHCLSPRLSKGRHSVQLVATSVSVIVYRHPPGNRPPQWA